MEPLEVLENTKKRETELAPQEFLESWKHHKDEFTLCELGSDELRNALFEESEFDLPHTLWKEIKNKNTRSEDTPARSVRRLILRPSENNWFPEELYDEMLSRQEAKR